MIHSEFGPSSLERRELCPGSYRLEKDLPGFETEHAAEGTRLHEVVANAIKKYCDTDEEVTFCENEEYAKLAFEKFKEILSDACLPHAAEIEANKEDTENCYTVEVEHHLELQYLGETVMFGTADVVAVLPDKVVVIDWKFGHRAVEDAANNNQGAAYAVMAMLKYRKENAEVHFFNPVIFQHTKHTFTQPDSIKRYILNIISACKAENAPIVAGEKQCRYCKANHHGTCPAVNRTATDLAVSAADIIPLPALSVLPEDKLRELFDKGQLVEKLMERVKAEIGRRADANGSCCGMAWKETSGGRECKDINGLFTAVSGQVTNTEFLETCTVSVAKLEKLYAAKIKASGVVKTEKDGKAEFNAVASSLIAEKAKKRSLVKAG